MSMAAHPASSITASSIKMNVVRQIIKDLGLDLQTLQSEGKLKAVEIPEGEKEKQESDK